MDIDTSYDIPYLSGISLDGRKVYIDRSFVSTISDGHTLYDIGVFLAIREVATREQLGMGLKHPQAHANALEVEMDAVERSGVPIELYRSIVESVSMQCRRKVVSRAPKDLDLRPYEYARDTKTLMAIKGAQR